MSWLKKILRKRKLQLRVEAHREFYNRILGKELRLDEPLDFNEKIHWLSIYYCDRKEGKLADKELVKKYVRSLRIDGLEIPKTLATYRNANEINLDDLPEKFVLKCNHFSGDVFVCEDKEKFDLGAAKKRLNEMLSKNFADVNLEYHYSYIKPLIMAEEYLNDGRHKNPIDYKFYCFDGKPDSILVCSNREKKLKFNDFDLNWNELNYTTKEYRTEERLKKPERLREMIKIAEELSAGMPFVRVDLYEVGEKIYFGEYTFTPGAGIIKHYRQSALDYLGNKIDLEKISR